MALVALMLPLLMLEELRSHATHGHGAARGASNALPIAVCKHTGGAQCHSRNHLTYCKTLIGSLASTISTTIYPDTIALL